MTKYFNFTTALLLTITLALTSCFSTKSQLGTKYNYTWKLTGNNAITDRTFNDGKISVFFIVGDKDVNFTLKNLTNDPMKINWDEASLIIYGQSKRVMHNGVKFIDRSSPQAPTVIPGNSSIDDLVLPTDNVYYREGYYSTYFSRPGGWEKHDLFLSRDGNKEDTKKLILDSKGQKFRFFLPIEQNGLKLNYTFEFEATEVSPVTKS
ncbi:MAG: hypothetical protein EKK37_16470 [Sphingobacteriales bacterium]|nr:MAG: hypothetical protein EKK37_16470 [Sphingobacteriales bacterium]